MPMETPMPTDMGGNKKIAAGISAHEDSPGQGKETEFTAGERGSCSLLLLFQLLGSTYPVGGFSHSFGLEMYISRDEIKNVEDLREYLLWTLHQSYLHFEGPSFCLAHEAGKSEETATWRQLDLENTAMRLSRENRQASLKMGQAFWRTAQAVFGEERFGDIWQEIKKNRSLGNYSVAAGYLTGALGIPLEEALQAFLFNGINNLVQAGVKMIPLGQSESQKMLYSVCPQIGETVAELLVQKKWEITNFVPAQDILSMQHERLYTRLYMS